jgi:hypothetical protein
VEKRGGNREGRRAGLKEGAFTTDRSVAQARATWRLLERVYGLCQAAILEACTYSSIPAEFLGALTANESGGNLRAARFEPSVYDHLKALASGQAPVYGGIRASALEAEVEEMLHPKAGAFHARCLGPSFGAEHSGEVAVLDEEALRELATSWGYTQIMGYHVVGRQGTVRDLLEPRFHYGLAVRLLSEFARDYQLDLMREFAEMFRCWNTGGPYGKTSDPEYVEKGLRRMELYRELCRRKPAEGVA